MKTIRQLLNRVRWDPEFARSEFELGYFDRVENRVVIVPLRAVRFPERTPAAFETVGEDGRIHRVPFHRVRDVYRDGHRIWHREPVS